MIRSSSAILAFVTVGLAIFPARGATPAQVNDALEQAKQYLYSKQKNGNWERVPEREERDRSIDSSGQNTASTQWGGQTALAVFALMVAGEDPQGPKLAPAVEFVKKADIIGTYALGVRCQVLLKLPQTEDVKALMRKDLSRLVGMMKTKDHAKGFYDYDDDGGPLSYSLSRAQYAVLGVWAAAQSGQEVSSNYWTAVEKAWVDAQEKDGGWRYWPHKTTYPVTAGITAVGIATLFIVQDQIYSGRGIDCRSSGDIPAIQKGIDWMTKNFDRFASDTEYPREFPNPTLYAVERVGVAGGLKYFGKNDWFKKGSEYLLKTQKTNGSWSGGLSIHSDTCFGIIFLSRGRAPVIFNKLDWAADDKAVTGNWNRRPRDIANVTHWIGRTSERELNWQIVDLQAPIEDWHDAPILYLSGSDPIKITDVYKAKLKQYVEEGGMILAHADCGKSEFVGSIKTLAGSMFPGYELRELAADHPIYKSVFSREKWKSKPSVLGLSNGVRELMVVIPQADPGKAWQIGVVKGREDAWQLAANIVYYAAEQRSLRNKGETFLVADDPSIKTTASLKLARLKYKGNWDPEPGGWRRLRNILRRNDRLNVVIEPVDLDSGSLEGVQVAHLTGTTKFKLDDAAKAKLKKFVAGGGTLVIDAAGGAEPFASSVEEQVESLGTGAELEILPPDHSLFGGKDGPKIGYRPFAQHVLTGKLNAPRIKAVRVADRAAILFSREDLSGGLVGQTVGGIVGYTPGTATELMRRIVLRAAGLEPSAAPTPATKPVKAKTKVKGKSKGKKPAAKPIDAKPDPSAPVDDSGLD